MLTWIIIGGLIFTTACLLSESLREWVAKVVLGLLDFVQNALNVIIDSVRGWIKKVVVKMSLLNRNNQPAPLQEVAVSVDGLEKTGKKSRIPSWDEVPMELRQKLLSTGSYTYEYTDY